MELLLRMTKMQDRNVKDHMFGLKSAGAEFDGPNIWVGKYRSGKYRTMVVTLSTWSYCPCFRSSICHPPRVGPDSRGCK